MRTIFTTAILESRLRTESEETGATEDPLDAHRAGYKAMGLLSKYFPLIGNICLRPVSPQPHPPVANKGISHSKRNKWLFVVATPFKVIRCCQNICNCGFQGKAGREPGPCVPRWKHLPRFSCHRAHPHASRQGWKLSAWYLFRCLLARIDCPTGTK